MPGSRQLRAYQFKSARRTVKVEARDLSAAALAARDKIQVVHYAHPLVKLVTSDGARCVRVYKLLASSGKCGDLLEEFTFQEPALVAPSHRTDPDTIEMRDPDAAAVCKALREQAGCVVCQTAVRHLAALIKDARAGL